MENLNAEQIKKELVLLIDDMPAELHFSHKKNSIFLSFLKSILAVIETYEQKIFALENRLKECENGYEGTLHLESCKLHEAEEKVKELTQAHEMLSESYDHLEKTKDELLAERSRLTEENERLKWQNAHLECVGEVAVKNRDECEQQLHYLSNVEIPYLYEALEGKGKDVDKLLDILSNALEKAKADTVRKMQERLKAKAYTNNYCQEIVLGSDIDQIAKEILENGKARLSW